MIEPWHIIQTPDSIAAFRQRSDAVNWLAAHPGIQATIQEKNLVIGGESIALQLLSDLVTPSDSAEADARMVRAVERGQDWVALNLAHEKKTTPVPPLLRTHRAKPVRS